MPSPFPGMDPYIEACGLWGDFHDKLIGELERVLAQLLPPRYVARIRDRTYIDWVDPREDAGGTTSFEPNVSVRRVPGAGGEQGGSVTVAQNDSQAVVMHAMVEVEYREIFLEVRELDPQRRLVTCIEVVSPTNKRPGTSGWLQYDRKRQVFLHGHANFVEIDLLRGGQRRGMQEPWPNSPYYMLAMRGREAPACQVWPAYMTEPLPEIAIPLAPPDEDLRVQTQTLVDAIYARSRYDVDIDYTRQLDPPLKSDEARFLKPA